MNRCTSSLPLESTRRTTFFLNGWYPKIKQTRELNPIFLPISRSDIPLTAPSFLGIEKSVATRVIFGSFIESHTYFRSETCIVKCIWPKNDRFVLWTSWRYGTGARCSRFLFYVVFNPCRPESALMNSKCRRSANTRRMWMFIFTVYSNTCLVCKSVQRTSEWYLW